MYNAVHDHIFLLQPSPIVQVNSTSIL